MIEGKFNKILEEVCLLDCVYIRDSKLKIKDLLNQLIAKLERIFISLGLPDSGG